MTTGYYKLKSDSLTFGSLRLTPTVFKGLASEHTKIYPRSFSEI